MKILSEIKQKSEAIIESKKVIDPCTNHFADKLYTEQAQTILRLCKALEMCRLQRDLFLSHEEMNDENKELEEILRGEW